MKKKLDYKAYPAPDATRSGAKVGWYYYRDHAVRGRAAAEVAERNTTLKRRAWLRLRLLRPRRDPEDGRSVSTRKCGRCASRDLSRIPARHDCDGWWPHSVAVARDRGPTGWLLTHYSGCWVACRGKRFPQLLWVKSRAEARTTLQQLIL